MGRYTIICFGIIFALVNLGFNVTTLITILGTLGLAFGLACQDTLKNIIAGIYLSINNIFNIGDVISLKLYKDLISLGTIIDFNLYYTTIIEKETNFITIIPNTLLQNHMLTIISKVI